MGLDVGVGFLSQLLEDDPESADDFRAGLAKVGDVLVERGLPRHVEAESVPAGGSRASLTGFPYSTIHYLRRVAVRLAVDPAWTFVPVPDDREATDDPDMVTPPAGFASHLYCHSDCEGYYVPVDFADVIEDDGSGRIPGGYLGSSHRLLAELRALAGPLGIALADGALTDAEAARVDDLAIDDDCDRWREYTAWLALFEAARLSVEYRTAIVFA